MIEKTTPSDDKVLARAAALWRSDTPARDQAPASAARARFLNNVQQRPRRRAVPWIATITTVAAALWLVIRPITVTRDAHALVFSDGSRVGIDADANLRVASIGWRGATLTLARGRGEIAIRKRALTRYEVDAGPFRVTVAGARFVLDWSPDNGRLTITVHDGQAHLDGPTLNPNGATLSSGDSVAINVAPTAPTAPATTTTAAAPMNGAAPASTTIKIHGLEPTPRAPATRTTAARAHARASSWNEDIAAGRFDAVINEARAEGIDDVLAHRAAADLSALADAARYRGDRAFERRALDAERARFTHTVHGAMAAFLLGRLADDTGDPGGAARWYQRYLNEAPTGPFAEEALGRQVVARARVHDAGVRALARAYLDRYPDGVYARATRAALGTP